MYGFSTALIWGCWVQPFRWGDGRVWLFSFCHGYSCFLGTMVPSNVIARSRFKNMFKQEVSIWPYSFNQIVELHNGEARRAIKGRRHKSYRQMMRDIDELDELINYVNNYLSLLLYLVSPDDTTMILIWLVLFPCLLWKTGTEEASQINKELSTLKYLSWA